MNPNIPSDSNEADTFEQRVGERVGQSGGEEWKMNLTVQNTRKPSETLNSMWIVNLTYTQRNELVTAFRELVAPYMNQGRTR